MGKYKLWDKFKQNFTCCVNHSWPQAVCCVPSVVSDSATPWTVACLTPRPMGFSRQEYWSGLLFPPPGDLPDPGSNPPLLHLLYWQVGSLPLAPLGKPMGKQFCLYPLHSTTSVHTGALTDCFCSALSCQTWKQVKSGHEKNRRQKRRSSKTRLKYRKYGR